VEKDLQPYVCLAGSCDGFYEFGERKAWSSHMTEYHGLAWSSLIHPTTQDIQNDRASNICPICCYVPVEINPSPYQQIPEHGTDCHSQEGLSNLKTTLKDETVRSKSSQQKVTFDDDAFRGQDNIHGLTSRNGAWHGKEKQLQEQAKMARHVAGHLRELAFLSARLYLAKPSFGESVIGDDVINSSAPPGLSIKSTDSLVSSTDKLPTGDWSLDPDPPHSAEALKLIAEQRIPYIKEEETEFVLRSGPGLNKDYSLAIICALPVEKVAFVAMLDEVHEPLHTPKDDENSYTFGNIGNHNIIVACLPAGMTGNNSVATVATDMLRSYHIKIGLMVGIGGGVWSQRTDIRLGDVVISQPEGTHGGVVQWDFGKIEHDGFRQTRSLNKPPRPLLNAVQDMKEKHMLEGDEIAENLARMVQNRPKLARAFVHQGFNNDCLYEASYNHAGGETCDRCATEKAINRSPRTTTEPQVHYGNIASSNVVVKNGEFRDRIARDLGVICFEMEAAGLMDTFPCLVIRGICDYADSHKNKRWQPYAAATAAAYAKELIGVLKKQEVDKLKPYGE
jgi:nucleoside phosphorylase